TESVKIYSLFTSSKYAANGSLMNHAGFMVFDFAIFLNDATSSRPMVVHFHPGGSDFLDNITSVQDSEINLSVEDNFPGTDNAAFWGANENFDIYQSAVNTSPPVSGINYNFFQQQINVVIDWAIGDLPVDSNRIYLEGSSFGACG